MSSSTARPRIPSATYRLQFNKDFTFAQAREIVPYLRALGIGDCYASPFFQASPGSNHGYDIVDHNRLNPEIGTEADFDAMVEELHKHGMGLVADFVPNHMGISESVNNWWMDVLENGPSSLAAPCFDIDWHPLKPELENKVLLPILGDQYGRVLEKGELKLAFEGGAFFLYYYQAKLPINPRTYCAILQGALAELPAGAASPSIAGLSEIGAVAVGAGPAVRGGDYQVSELQSIITQLEKMPPRTATERDQIVERAREKEVAKLRLEQLCADHPAVAEALQRALVKFHGHPGDPGSFNALDQLIESQAYRLSYWRVAAEEINYRRFFDINTLAAIRVELPEVFEATHQLLWRLLGSGKVTGLRIDHPDGLYDPRGYFAQLQENYARLRNQPLPEDGRGIYLLGEKILSGEERLPREWPVHGTTGYDFTNQVTALLVDHEAEESFSETYQRFIDRNVHFPSLVYEKKRLVMRLSLANDVNVLGHMLNRLSERNRLFRDFTLNALTTTVREVIACFPVYRTYLAPGRAASPEDKAVINRAVAQAKRRNPGMDASVFDFLRDILLFRFPLNPDDAAGAAGAAEHERFVMKFQQCTGPIMAKGLEDTAFYIYNRLAALNEVGGEPQHFGMKPEDFHRTNVQRRESWPHTMLTSSTHDTKRGEDVRARIAALSEMPQRWRRALRTWTAFNRKHKTAAAEGELAPDPNEEYLLYQILLGSWPFIRDYTPKPDAPEAKSAANLPSAIAAMTAQEHASYLQRIQDYMTKAIKEAKVNSSWIQPNEAWDDAVRKFIAALMPRGKKGSAFLKAFEPMAAEIAQLGAINSLSQTVLKLTSPGVPDIYQGNEIWDFSLVDPDNRRPIDYALRRRLLESLSGADPAELLANWQDGRIKLFITRSILRFRLEEPKLFESGTYQPLKTTGRLAECAVAFRREYAGASMLAVVPRLSSKVGFPPVGERWGNTAISLEGAGGAWRDLFTGRKLKAEAESGELPLSRILEDFPCAVLVR
jgi:(1->4)-alpha-D-glucan 1-alpha-D-glucosylmutase